MKKINILEQQTFELGAESDVAEIQDSKLRQAADADCFPLAKKEGRIVNYVSKHPITKVPAIQITAAENYVDEKNVRYPQQYFFTSQPSGAGYKFTGFYVKDGKFLPTGQESTWTCSRMGKKEELETILVERGGLLKKDTPNVDKNNYELINVLNDVDLKQGGRLYSQESAIPNLIETLKKYLTPLFMWKRTTQKAKPMDIDSKVTEVKNYLTSPQVGFSECPNLDDAELRGSYAIYYPSVDYPKSFDKNVKFCKKWSDIGTKKKDCQAVFDDYYDVYQKYVKSGGKIVSPLPNELGVMKLKFINCATQWSGRMPFRQKKITTIQELRPSNPYFLGQGLQRESTDELTTIIRESLIKVKKNKGI